MGTSKTTTEGNSGEVALPMTHAKPMGRKCTGAPTDPTDSGNPPEKEKAPSKQSQGHSPVLSRLQWLRQSISNASGIKNLVRSYNDVVNVAPSEPSSTTESSSQRQGAYHSLILGILLSVGTSAVLSLVSVIIKKLEASVSLLEVLTFMSFGVFIGILPVANEEVQPFGPSRAQPLLFVRAVLSLVSAALRLSSLYHMTIADSSIINSLSPVMVAITASLFLSEQFHWTIGASVALSLLGTILLVKPGFFSPADSALGTKQYVGVAYGLSHTILNGVTTVCIRATRGVSRNVVVFHYGCLSMLLVSVVSVYMGKLKIFYDGSQIGYLLLISHLTFAVQVILTKALQIGSPLVVTIVKTTADIILGYVMQAMFMKVYPDLYSVFAGVFVLLGVVAIGMRKVVETSSPGSKIRRRFQFLL
ncbi:pseudopaline exporter CntI-like [Haemaphysalis longicornis]